MKTWYRRVIHSLARESAIAQHQGARSQRDLDLIVARLLSEVEVARLNDPIAFVAAIRECLQLDSWKVKVVKDGGGPTARRRLFDTFVEAVKRRMPPVPTDIALRFAKISDDYRGLHETVDRRMHTVPLSRHFAIASSSGRKGRLLATAVAHFSPGTILEVGTAYGISSFLMGATMARTSATGKKLITIEGSEPQASLSRALLDRECSGLVQCEFGMSSDILPKLADKLGSVDFYFHDGGHTREDYQRDVLHVVDKLSPGAILILDDINWNDHRYLENRDSGAYQGWQEIVQSPSITCAFELDNEIGVALVGAGRDEQKASAGS